MAVRSRFIVAAVAVALSVLGAARSPALACTGEQPTFEAAVAGATAIARVVIVETSAYRDDSRPERHRILRALKGDMGGEIVIDDPRANGCGDRIGLYASVGDEAIIAYGVPFFGSTLNVVWVERPDDAHSVHGSASIPDGVATLDDMERAIVAALPDTAVTRATTPPNTIIGAILFMACALITGRRVAGRWRAG